MKNLKLIALGAFFSLSFFSSFAQHAPAFTDPNYNKPKLFSDLPEKLNLDIPQLENLFLQAESKHVKFFIGEFNFQGNVVSKSNPADKKVQSIIIKSTNRMGAAFTFTKIINEDGSIAFKGRILSRDHSDAYDMQKENDQYFFIKKHQLEILNE
jgi:hypothetical protein